jgi:hypothetical protein
MKHPRAFSKSLILVAVCLSLAGCESLPKNLLVLPPDYLSAREQQMRKYATTDDKKVIQAAAGALQDLGFTIDKSEIDLGMVVSSKNRTAVSAGQVTAALTADVACVLFGCYSNMYGKTDKAQKIEASVMVNSSLAKDSTVVRVKFQTVVWNVSGQVSRFETIKDPKLYQEFFERVSKSIFLEEQKI